MAVYQNLSLTQKSQNATENYSMVRILWQSQQTGASWNGYTNTAKYWISINGGDAEEYSVSYTLPQYTNQTILDITVKVPHDEEGDGRISVSTRMDTGISAGVVTLSKALDLTPIARASTLVATDAYVGAVATIVVAQKNQDYTHSIQYKFGELTGYIVNAVGEVSDTEVKHTVTSIGFPIPTEFYAQIPAAPSGACTLICRTYSGEEQIGTDQTATFTVTARESECAPVVQGTVEDCNPETVALTGDESILVQGFSTAKCKITASSRNEAWITSATVNGTEIAEEVDIPNVETGSFQFTAWDSRGYSGSSPVELSLIPYFPVTGVLTGERKNPGSYEADIQIKGTWFSGSFGVAENALYIAYRVDAGEYVEMTPEIDGNSYTATAVVPDLDYTKNSTVEVLVQDSLSYTTTALLIKKGIPVFDWGENDFRFNVKVLMSGQSISGLPEPEESSDAATKAFAMKAFLPDGEFPSITTAEELNDLDVNGFFRLPSDGVNINIGDYTVRIVGNFIVIRNGSQVTKFQLATNEFGDFLLYRVCWYGYWRPWKALTASEVTSTTEVEV